MKRVLSLLAGFLGAAVFLTASPITYNINFTNGSPNPTSGSFQYDSAGSGTFSNFIVLWQGFNFDLTSQANAPSVSGSCVSSASNSFALLNGTLACVQTGPGPVWGADSSDSTALGFADFEIQGFDSSSLNDLIIQDVIFVEGTQPPLTRGNFTITNPVATPEPGSIALAFIGGASLLAWKRRRQN